MTPADSDPYNALLPKEHNARAGDKTAFVLGNGPSLARVDLHSLSDFATIGLNAAYRHWRQIDWRPRYYACLDTVVGLSHKEAIAELIAEGRIERFLLRENLIEALGASTNMRVVNYDAARQTTPLLALDPITTGSHSALWSASMGYQQIVLLGVDVNYTEVVDGAARRDGIELEIVRSSANPNYYFEGYQAPGDKFNLPNPRPDLHVNAWRRAAQGLKTGGVAAYNANPDSGVRCFPYVNLDRFLSAGDTPAPAGEQVDAYLEVAPHAGLSRRERLRAFKKAYLVRGLIVGALALVLLGGWLLAAKPSAAFATMMTACLFGALAAATAGLYARFAILSHLHQLDEEVTALRARLSTIEHRTTSENLPKT